MNGSTNPKISVIIPVYKAEKYIHKCITSLFNQTFKDYEILLIDDGSPDNSGKICDYYAQKDTRIRVVHKENGGVSSARQCGIDHAKGEYTIHVDPDDWVEPTMLEELYHKALEDNADMVICDFIKYYSETKQVYIKQEPTSLNHDIVLKNLFQHLQGSCCNKLIKRICYNKYNIKFPENFNLYEDLYVCACILKHPINISYLNKAFYYYSINTNATSMVKCIDYKTLKEDSFFFETMNELLKDLGHINLLFKRYISYSIVLKALKYKNLTNDEFLTMYKKYTRYILFSPQGRFLGKLICFISCLGLYRITKTLYRY